MVRKLKTRGELPEIIADITATYSENGRLHHLGETPLPNVTTIVQFIEDLRAILFPGYFGKEQVSQSNVNYYVGELLHEVHQMLSAEIYKAWQSCQDEAQEEVCLERAEKRSLEFLRKIPQLRELLSLDVEAAYAGDPAAKGLEEIIFSYPGVLAITIYRLAHELFCLEVPLIPRIMTEHAHRVTGIDIHPGAKIGESFFIDHGTGVVIGETTEIGKNVKVYQGVTLGALSFKEGAEAMRRKKRHPTIGDNVVIYAGATILGGETVIGEDSVIGGNVWVISSLPARSKVMMELPKLRIQVNE